MQTLRLDRDNNIVITRGLLSVTDGATACAIDTRTRIGLCRGENPFDTTDGADFYNELLGKMGGVAYLREEIRKRITANDEIVGIRQLDITENAAAQTTTINARIATIYGDIEL